MSAIEDHYPVECPFCAIAGAYPAPKFSSSVIPGAASGAEGAPSAYVILNTPDVLAFLDHAPISRGHVLVIAREHRAKLSDCHVHEAQALGGWLPVVSRAVMHAVDPLGQQQDDEGADEHEVEHAAGSREAREHDIGDWNIVQNNGARAAQVVPHVHFHIIPRSGAVPKVEARSWTIFGRGQRQDLDDDDAASLVVQVREQLAHELDELTSREGPEALDALLGSHARTNGWKL